MQHESPKAPPGVEDALAQQDQTAEIPADPPTSNEASQAAYSAPVSGKVPVPPQVPPPGSPARSPWRRELLVAAFLALMVVGFVLFRLFQPPPIKAGDRPNVVLIVIDTLRADHLTQYGHFRQTTPVLDHVAQEGILFKRGTSATNWTLPSVSSILTGLPPTSHGVRAYEDQLPDAVETVAERLHAIGYHTAFFGVNSLFEAGRNLQQGFDKYFGMDEIPAEELNQNIQAWLQDRPVDKPTFLYLHYFDPHCRYEPPMDYRGMYWPPTEAQKTHRMMTQEQWKLMHECFQLHFNPGEPILDVDRYLSEYDAELRHTDHQVGMILERLKTAGLYDSSLLIVTSDHGEEFYDHNGYGHGKVLLEHNVHVPLMMRLPRGLHGGRVEEGRVSSIDLVPTILDAVGIPIPEELLGMNLGPVLREEATIPADRAVFSETDYEGKQRAILQGDLKLLLSPDKSRGQGLYDLKADPGEKHDVSKERPADFERLGRAMADYERRAMEVGKNIPGTRQELSQQTIEQLRSLGYTP